MRNASMPDLLTEVARFQSWAEAFPLEQRSGEWECLYQEWALLYAAVRHLLSTRLLADWSQAELAAVLYAVARDNEDQILAHQIGVQYPQLLLPLAEAASESGEPEAKWQFAQELGQATAPADSVEPLLLIFSQDGSEYVRRQALCSLARIGSPAVETLALSEWQRPDDSQQWMRMMVLWCLHRVKSSHLDGFLRQAEQDERPYLSAYARRVSHGEVEP